MQTRRDALTMLLSSLPMLSLPACGGRGDAPSGPDTTPDTDGDIVRPILDTSRLQAGLAAVLANSPWSEQVDTLIAGAAAEIDALRTAGYDDTADVATFGLNGVVGNVAAGFAESLAARNTDDQDYTALSEALIDELATTCVGMRASLPSATAEIGEALGGDTVPSSDESVTAMLEYEGDIRQMMYEKDLSGQGGMGLLLYQMQSSRAELSSGVSLGSASSKLDSALSGMASDEDVEAFSARTIRRIVLRQLERGGAPPSTDTELEELCDAVGWVGFFVGWMGAIHKAVGKTAEKMADFVDELPEAYDYLKASWKSWLAADLTDAVLEQTESQVINAIKGKATTATAEQCNQLAAFIIVVLWFISLITTLIAFAQSISWLAGTLGAFTAGGTVALVFILMLVIILFYVLEMLCAILSILPTVEILFGECGE